jgi:hypothetical protein
VDAERPAPTAREELLTLLAGPDAGGCLLHRRAAILR